jgi:calcium-dependent protein kinase
MLFDFDLKFGFKVDTKEVFFEKGDTKLTYQLLNEEDVTIWREVLKSKMNQRGFHEQFKALDKIGKGNFASVYLV